MELCVCVWARARARFKWVFVTINHPSPSTSLSVLGCFCYELIPRPIKAVYPKVPCEVTPESWNRTPTVTLYRKIIILSSLWWIFFATALSFNQITSLKSHTAIFQTFVCLFVPVVYAELIKKKNSTSHKVTVMSIITKSPWRPWSLTNAEKYCTLRFCYNYVTQSAHRIVWS